MKKKRNKQIFSEKALSPVIATVLLISMVVVIGLIIFLWFKGIVQEEGTKFGKNVKLVCDDIDFEASYSDGTLNIINIGNVAIYEINLKIEKEASYETEKLVQNWPTLGLNQGETYSGDISGYVIDANKIVLIPTLIGSSSEGKKPYTCEEQYGHEITL